MLKGLDINLSGMNAIVIGRSNIVGKPMAQLLLKESCTVTVAHSKTKNLEEVCKSADIVVAAVGRPQMVKGGWIKKGAVVIDVGINRIELNTNKAIVTREVDGGLQVIEVSLPAVISVDLRLNEPRYASLPNIMKAKRKPLEQKTPEDFNIKIKNRLEILETKEPHERPSGIKVSSVDELVEKLKNEVGVI